MVLNDAHMSTFDHTNSPPTQRKHSTPSYASSTYWNLHLDLSPRDSIHPEIDTYRIVRLVSDTMYKKFEEKQQGNAQTRVARKRHVSDECEI
jgi:hypothetical protein